MQKYPSNLSKEERRIARRWTLASVGLYGSVLAGLMLYGAFQKRPVDVAAADPVAKVSAAKLPRDDAFKSFAKVTQRRFCGQVAC
jgi:hypothetical protein